MITLEEKRNSMNENVIKSYFHIIKKGLNDNITIVNDCRASCVFGVSFWCLNFEKTLSTLVVFGVVSIEGANILLTQEGKIIRKMDFDELFITIVNRAFKYIMENINYDENTIKYSKIEHCFGIRTSDIPLKLSDYRNLLIEFGFFSKSSMSDNLLIINAEYEKLVSKHIKQRQRKISLKTLLKQLEAQKVNGDKAEVFVYGYELKRLLNHEKLSKVKRISEIDVAAGYDIISFDSIDSDILRYIEVKSYTSAKGFYWTKNERNKAELIGDNYYIYLVDVCCIDDNGYEPLIIPNPYEFIEKSEQWFVEADSYYVRNIE